MAVQMDNQGPIKRFLVNDEVDGTWAMADTAEEAEAARLEIIRMTENMHGHVLTVIDIEGV